MSGKKILDGLEDAVRLAQSAPADGDADMDKIAESCGCVFCDLGLDPELQGDELVHFTNDEDRPWVICGRSE